MEESVTYQAIIQKGEARGEAKGLLEGEKRSLLRVGRKRLGQPSLELVERIEEITDEATLMELLDRVAEIPHWDDLFVGR